MTWIVDGIPLSTLAFNVQNRAAGWKVPAKRGENLVIPGRHGSQWIPNKPFEEGSISLTMWAVGATEDGEMPDHGNQRRQARDNLDKLTAIFAQSAKLLEIIQVSGLAFGAQNTAENPGFETISTDTNYTYQNSIINPAMRRKAATTQFTNLFGNPLMLTPQSSSWSKNFEDIVWDPYNKLDRTATPDIYQSNYWAPTSFEPYASGDTIGSNWTVAANTTATVQNNTAADQTANPLGGTKVFRVLATAALGSNASLGVRPPMYVFQGAQPHLRFRFRRSQNTTTVRSFQIRMLFTNEAGGTVWTMPWKDFAIPNGSSTWADATYTREDYTSNATTVTDPAVHVKVEFRTGQAWSINDGLIMDTLVLGHHNYTSGPFLGVAGPFWDGDAPWGGTSWSSTAGTSISRWHAKRDIRWVAATPTLISNAYYAFAEQPASDSTGTTLGFVAMGVQSGGTQVFTYQCAPATAGIPYTLRFNWRGRSGTTTRVGLYKQGSGDSSPVLVGSEHVLNGTATPIGTGTRMNGAFATDQIGPTYFAQTGDTLFIRVTVPVRTDGHHAFQFSQFHLTDAAFNFSGDSSHTANSQYWWFGDPWQSKSIIQQRRVKRITSTPHALISTVIASSTENITVAEAVCRATGMATEIVGESTALPVAVTTQGLYLSSDSVAGNLNDAPVGVNPVAEMVAEILDTGGSVLRTKISGTTTLNRFIAPTPAAFKTLSVSFGPEEIPAGGTHVRMTVRLVSPQRAHSLLTTRWLISASSLAPTLAGAPYYFDGTTAGAVWTGTAHDSSAQYQIQYPTAWTTSGVPTTGDLSAISVPTNQTTEVSYTISMSGVHNPMEYLLGVETFCRYYDEGGNHLFGDPGVAKVRAEFLDAGGNVVTAAECGEVSASGTGAIYDQVQGAIQVTTAFTQLRLVFSGAPNRYLMRVWVSRVFLFPNNPLTYTCPAQRINFNGVFNPNYLRGLQGWEATGTTVVSSTKGPAIRLADAAAVARSGSLLPAPAGTKLHTYIWARATTAAPVTPRVRYSRIVARNLITNPSLANPDETLWGSVPAGVRGSSLVTIGGFSRRYYRITFAGHVANSQIYAGASLYDVPVTPGTTYFFSMFSRASRSAAVTLILRWYQLDGTYISQANTAGTLPGTTSWTEMWSTGVAPAGAAYARLSVSADAGVTWASGNTWDATCARVVAGQTSHTPYWESGDTDAGGIWTTRAPDGTHLYLEYTSETLPEIAAAEVTASSTSVTVPATWTHASLEFRGAGAEVSYSYLGKDFATHEYPGYYDPYLFSYFDGTSGTDLWQQPTYWQGANTDNGLSRVAPNIPADWVFTPSTTGANVHLGSGLAVKPAGSKGKVAWVPRIAKGTTRSFRTVGVARGSNIFLSGELSVAFFAGVDVEIQVWGAASETAAGALLYYGESVPHPGGTAIWLDLPIHYHPYYYVQVNYTENYNGSGYRLRFDNLLMMPTEQLVGATEYPGYFDGDTNGAGWLGLPNQSASQYFGGGRRAFAEVKDAIDMTSMAGGTRAEFGVEMVIPASFWEDLLESSQTVTVDVATGGTFSTTRELTSLAGTTAPIDDSVITITRTGTITNLELRDVATGAWMKINGTLPNNVTINNSDFTVLTPSSSLIASVTRGGSNQLLPLTPESSVDSPRLGVSASGTGTITITIVCRRKYVIA